MMTENMDSGLENEQENSENLNNEQENSELTLENPEENTNDSNNTDESSKEEDLDLPEPDVSEEEVKKKKEIPEWMKKKLERERLASERKEVEAEALKAEVERLRSLTQSNQAPTQKHSDSNIPSRDNFNSDAEYFLALSDYRDNARQQENLYRQRQQSIQQAEKSYQNKLKDAVDSGKEKYKDFEARTDYILYGEGFPSNRAMGEAIIESDHKDDILYFLGTHVKEAERIAHMNPVQAVKEITKIESRFTAKRKSNITKAPKPLDPVGSTKGAATHGDPSKMSQEQFESWYTNNFR
jgi:hypothetical protein